MNVCANKETSCLQGSLSQLTQLLVVWHACLVLFRRVSVCYGFFIIDRAEGRNEAFSFLTKYFTEAPEYVVYDFACALQE